MSTFYFNTMSHYTVTTLKNYLHDYKAGMSDVIKEPTS
jgi:hypothetical protein